MPGITAHFNFDPKTINPQCITIVPYKSDEQIILQRLDVDIASVGWNIITIRELIETFKTEIFWPIEISDIQSFAIAHRIFLESDFHKELVDLRKKPSFPRKLMEFFQTTDQAGILEHFEIDRLLCSSKLGPRTKEALTLYKKFREELRNNALATYDYLFHLALKAVKKGRFPQSLKFKEIIIFFNFMEFNIPQREFVMELGKIKNVSLCFPIEYCDYPVRWREPINNLLNEFGIYVNENRMKSQKAITLVLNGEYENLKDNIQFLLLPDPQREVRIVARLAKYYTIKDKIDTQDMLIITPDTDAYKSLLSLELGFVGLDFPDQASTHNEADLENLFSKLMTAVASDWRREELIQLFKHPILQKAYPELESKWIEQYTAFNKLIDIKSWQEIELEDEKAIQILELIGKFDFLKNLIPANKLESTMQHISNILSIQIGIESLPQLKDELSEQWSRIINNAKELEKGYCKLKFTGLEFLAIQLSLLKRKKFKAISSKIRILPPLEARGVNAKIIFIIGFNRSNYPQRHNPNPIIDTDYRDIFSFISDKEGISRISLIQSMCLAEKVIITIPQTSGEDNDLALCHPIDEIMRFCGISLEMAQKKAIEIWDELENLERKKVSSTLTQIPNEDIVKLISPYQIDQLKENIIAKGLGIGELEKYHICPLLFLLSKSIGKPETEKITLETNWRIIGTAIHDALKDFLSKRFMKIFNEEPFGKGIQSQRNRLHTRELTPSLLKQFINKFKLNNRENFNCFAEQFFGHYEEFDELISELRKSIFYNFELIWKTEPSLLINKARFLSMFTEKQLNDILESIINITGDDVWLPIGFEVPIQERREIDGHKILIKGRIDRVDLSFINDLPYLCIIDYKSSDINSVYEFQLNAYGTMLSRAGFEIDNLSCIYNLIRDEKVGQKEFKFNYESAFDPQNKQKNIDEILFSIWDCKFDPLENRNCKSCIYKKHCSQSKYDKSKQFD